MKRCYPLSLVVVLLGATVSQAENTIDVPMCAIVTTDGRQVIVVARNMEALLKDTGPFAQVAPASQDTLYFDGLEVSVDGVWIKGIRITGPTWSTSSGITIGTSREQVLQRLSFISYLEFSPDKSVSFSNPDFMDNPGDMCMTEIQLDQNDRVENIAIWHAPISISPALPVLPLLQPSKDK